MSEWISVTDRLPPMLRTTIRWVRQSDAVLICWKDDGPILGWLRQVAHTDGNGNIISWEDEPEWTWGDISGPGPDYWMPLPKRPND